MSLGKHAGQTVSTQSSQLPPFCSSLVSVYLFAFGTQKLLKECVQNEYRPDFPGRTAVDKDRHSPHSGKGTLRAPDGLKGNICPPDCVSLLEHSEAWEAAPSHSS